MTNTQNTFQTFLNTLAQKDVEINALETISTDLSHWAKLDINSVEDFNSATTSLQKLLTDISKRDIENGSIFSLVDELSHWHDYNIYTVAQFDHYDAQTTHYELYNDVHEIKPRWIKYSEMTTEQINAEIDSLVEESKSQEQREKENAEEYSRIVQQRKAKNSYKPNNAFAGLKDLMKTEIT